MFKTKEEAEIIGNRINVSVATLYNWKKTKPELLKLLELGLQKEHEIEHGIESDEDFKKKVDNLERRMKAIETLEILNKSGEL